ncbi:HSP-70 cofactor [Acholeplasma oculi]|nr:nucleotide exchange factor GrpE [Acholeplasma oculi]SKC34875.1 molecular chaperone GrpE [Acholeplasma oculi]SUT89675.1 HSP-70 cofactor [Acholeplasma oculi]HLT00295.1 nucleotide exchange factor GrpE [Acholeplasma sp.]
MEDVKKDEVVDKQPQDESKKEKKHKLQVRIEELEAENKELNNKYLRMLADTENYKKRIQAERLTDKKYASSGFAQALLTPYEQFAKIVEFPTDNDLLKNFLIGFKMIKDQFEQALESEGVKEIKALGEMFDAKVHHAIEKDNQKDKANGIVLEVLQKGYYFKDRILRPAMVKINEWSEEDGKNE